MENEKEIKGIDSIDLDEMLESESVIQYMLENGKSGDLEKIYETMRKALEFSIKHNAKDLDLTKTSFVRKLNKYLYRDISEIADQEIADEVYYLDMLPKEIEITKSIQIFNNGMYSKHIKCPVDIMALKEKCLQLTNELISFKQSIHERLTQLFINRIDDVRHKIANGKLIPNYDDEAASKAVDKFNLLYKRFIDEMNG